MSAFNTIDLKNLTLFTKLPSRLVFKSVPLIIDLKTKLYFLFCSSVKFIFTLLHAVIAWLTKKNEVIRACFFFFFLYIIRACFQATEGLPARFLIQEESKKGHSLR